MKLKHLLLTTAVIAGVASGAAQAADAENDAAKGISDIIVTAEKVKQNVQKVSASITTIGAEEIQKTGASSLDQAIRNVPSLNIQGGFNNLYVRGVGSNQGPGEGGEPGVSVNLDGAAAHTGSKTSTLSTLVDVERVEVLRGPQGTLYGRNAIAGTVNIVTKNPVLGKVEGSVGVKAGNYDLHSYNGVINIPVGDTFAIRATATRELRDGYIVDGDGNHISGDTDVFSSRVKALYKPNDRFSVLGTFSYLKDSSSSMGVPNIYPVTSYCGGPVNGSGCPPFFPAPPAAGTTGHADNPWRNDGDVPGQPGATRTYTAQLEFQYDAGFANLTLLPSYTRIDSVCDRATTTICSSGRTEQKTVEFRASNKEDSLIKWTVGVYALDQKGSSAPTSTGIDSLSTSISESDVNRILGYSGASTPVELETAQFILPTRNYALFGQVTVPLSEQLRVKAGLRYSKESKRNQYVLYDVGVDADGPTYDSDGLCTNCTVVFQNDPTVEDTNAHPLTYTLGLEYDVAERSMLYASVSSGFKSGGISPVVVPPHLYKNENMTSFALGSKNRFLDNRVQLNLEAYYYRYKNYQINLANESSVTIGDYTDVNEFQSVTYNAGLGTIKGLEVESIFQLTDRDRLTLNAAYSKGKYGALDAPLGGPPWFPAEFSLTGGEMSFQPRVTINGSLSHDFDLFGGTLTPRVDAKYSASYLVTSETYLGAWWNFPMDPLYKGRYDLKQGAYAKVDAYINWVSGDGNISVGLSPDVPPPTSRALGRFDAHAWA